jgi:hypothetical protein
MQFTAFLIAATKEKHANSFRFHMLAKGAKTVLQYWLKDGLEWPNLQKIAVKLFSMATSSAYSERSFSTMGYILSKMRNSLNAKTVEKFVFIKSNLPAFHDYQHRRRRRKRHKNDDSNDSAGPEMKLRTHE